MTQYRVPGQYLPEVSVGDTSFDYQDLLDYDGLGDKLLDAAEGYVENGVKSATDAGGVRDVVKQDVAWIKKVLSGAANPY